MNNNYKSLIKENPIKEKCTGYEIYVSCDANDGDYIDNKFYIDDLFNDELFFLVLCYLCTEKAFGYPNNKNNKTRNVFGNHIGGYSIGDNFFDWIEDYCIEKDLLVFAGMCDCFCHSIDYIEITHYTQNAKYSVELPSIDKIFDTEQEMVDYMNKLYDNKN